MMNKQEAIDELENAIPDFILNDFQRGKETGLTYALELVEQLDEPEKPVVPQFVADWYEDNKDGFEYNLYRLCIDFYGRKLHEDLHEWFRYDKNKPSETLVLMHKFGYEVEKEKLYTARLKSTGEYLYYDKDYGNAYHMSVCDNIPQKVKGYHFTEEELIEYFAWENEAYETDEVEE